ncbi:Hsp70 family protein [Brooklawnia cerclae]|uniref:Molecular chaperone DnaK (HSP70) n=1 Tax=Brooklawnia cerclae TaxID=349934 RepID=A0ABX0SEJ4_9ACTN|nr:Hsp70 family protein [Brooklawnia cerclae]NIH56823.1 molecular chaperone DnaK (HSP70) [Brooklawnia cerclae]
MQLGIDFGTTRTIVAHADRGNFPVVAFMDEGGDAHEYVPSLVALTDDGLVSGFAAQRARAAGAPVLRSFKRALASPAVNTSTLVHLGSTQVRLLEVLTVFLRDLLVALHHSSTVGPLLHDDPLGQVVIAVPAHAHSAQRYLTLEAYRQAGFSVAAMMNEPSAAGFEYTHRLRSAVSAKRTRLVVYDLGGGTFDASLVSIHDRSHAVLGSIGINRLGGDDFDVVLADLACELAGVGPDALGLERYFQLLADAQAAKEQLSPQSKRIVLDVADTTVTIPVADYYEAVTPLVEQSVAAMAPLVDGLDDGDPDLSQIAGLYLVGGASSLPLVPRLLRETFGRRVNRSPFPAASTAIGLAIAADPGSGYTLSDRLSRGFGVFREAESGERLRFDSIFDRDAVLGHEQRVERRYRAVHNVGWYRFVEYAELADAQPVGDIVPFDDVLFPFQTDLQRSGLDLRTIPVERVGEGDLINESYVIDRNGIVSVTITDLDTGYSLTRQLGLS